MTRTDAPPRNRSPRGGAHRAPRSATPVRGSRATKASGGDKAGAPGGGSRQRTIVARTSAVVLLAAVIGIGLMRPGVPSAEPTVSSFLLAWESQHYRQAAELTTGNPTVVATELADAYQRLDASNLNLSMLSVSQHGKAAYARFNAAIELGGSGLAWSYNNGFSLADGPRGWRVTWTPSVIVPGMTSREQLAVVSSWWPRSNLLDSANDPLTVRSEVYRVGVTPGLLTNPAKTAAGLAAATQLSAEQIEGQMEQALPGKFLALLTLSPAGYATLQPKLSGIPGLVVKERKERLFRSIAPDVVGSIGTETARPLRINGMPYRPGTTVGLTGLQEAFQRQLTGTPETEVVLQQSGLRRGPPLHTWPGTAGKPVHTTLNSGVQLAADHALSDSPTSAAIVAVQAGTGKILAVASHEAGRMPGLQPLSGQYQPGQAFTIISSAAILSTGLSPGAPLPCRSVNSVGGRSFRNQPPEPDLGIPTFQTDFAHACSTAFAGLALRLPAADLTKASEDFGVGGWQLPVSNYFPGRIGQSSGTAMLAANMIGIGDVRVSPLGMALAASLVDSGEWHAPSLVTGTGLADSSSAPRGTTSPKVLIELRSLMRAAAKSSSNAAADIGGEVYAQAGSAPYGSGHLWINWFVGYRGSVAFTVVELAKSPSSAVSSLAGSFLRDIQTGS